jgi:hypothetical protein
LETGGLERQTRQPSTLHIEANASCDACAAQHNLSLQLTSAGLLMDTIHQLCPLLLLLLLLPGHGADDLIAADEEEDDKFAIVFAAMGVNMETAHFFKQVRRNLSAAACNWHCLAEKV